MAKDGFDAITDVRGLLNIPSVLALLGTGGKVDPSIKTTGSDVRGIVVNLLGITNDQDQIAIGNVNCYAPAIISTIGGKQVSLPNQAVLSTLAKAITELIDNKWKGSFQVWVEENATIVQDTDGSYFASIKFRYQSIQDNYTNI